MDAVIQQVEHIRRNAAEVLPLEELGQKVARSIEQDRPLTIKLGVDPTAPDLHLGHAVVLGKLRDFQELGHQVVLLIGDFTALVGDPSGQKTTRPVLTPEEIEQNARTYTEQAFKILDPERTVLDRNSRWFSQMSFSDMLRLCGAFTVARLLERDDFTQRMEKEHPIYLHELLYPVMQAYDSVALAADVEIGGTDQKFNMLAGRVAQLAHDQEPQVVVTMPILEGTDGVRKMSKSYGNYIGLTHPPAEMFGRIMSIPDELVGRYHALAAGTAPERVAEIESGLVDGSYHPAAAKRDLAEAIVARYHGEVAAHGARQEFDRVFKRHELPSDIPTMRIPPDIIDPEGRVGIVALVYAVELVASRSEARRLIAQQGIRLNDKVIDDIEFTFAPTDGDIVRIGKRKILKLQVE